MPVPAVVTRARPSAPTSMPCGAAGKVTVCATAMVARLITLREESVPLVT